MDPISFYFCYPFSEHVTSVLKVNSQSKVAAGVLDITPTFQTVGMPKTHFFLEGCAVLPLAFYWPEFSPMSLIGAKETREFSVFCQAAVSLVTIRSLLGVLVGHLVISAAKTESFGAGLLLTGAFWLCAGALFATPELEFLTFTSG